MKINIEELLKAPTLMTVREARLLVGVGETKIYDDIKDGKLQTTDDRPRMVRRDDLMAYVGITKEDIYKQRLTQVAFPVVIKLDNVHLVLDEEGNLSELWLGKPGQGRLFELVEVD